MKRGNGRRNEKLQGIMSALRSHHGFTLVEMMVALVVFGLGLMALAQTMPQGLSMRDRARRMSVATNLAQQEVERLRGLPFDDPQLAGGAHSDPMGPVEVTCPHRSVHFESQSYADISAVCGCTAAGAGGR